MDNIDIPEEPINDLGKTQFITEEIMNDFKNVMSEQLEKAEKKITEEIKNHLTTNKNLIDAKKKLGEQERTMLAQQTQIYEQEKKISIQEAQLDEQEKKISVQQAQSDEQYYELTLQKEKIQDLLEKVVEFEKNNSSNNIFRTVTIVIVVVAATTIVNRYIK